MGSAHSKWSRIRSYLDSTTTRSGFVDGSSRMVKFGILWFLSNIFGKSEVDQIANLDSFCSMSGGHVSWLSSFPNKKTTPTQNQFWKTKSRALQLHFGTSPSARLQIVYGTLEVEDHVFGLAQKLKCLTSAECSISKWPTSTFEAFPLLS